ncbi:helix-turn-helix domain-containing protein [Micromonospora parathelypteridis]|uniref:Transcriptional regulator with XRE-family HTH domain n=1 Tax=Micromonospora parathelypteridis TaxID=1839617 RepID=A0A840WA07_9ACTN|nr:helix-turn-helix transcriptional regulator [Micromonospora parathelypteridis]MBB5480949.1 transcriptional regulator with XRE-family HTH domain [Micromonospora parathelypteridis]GGO20833.1 transcriptional regulator [Micromonospora parathelypteridis]
MSGGNAELRAFLWARRARLAPEQAGLPARPGTRRVPGLRREEVARLAGVSTDYYIQLERGHNLNVSESVLKALARALQLDETERSHLLALARFRRSPAGHQLMPAQRVRPSLRHTLDALDVPALVIGRRCDVLATNALGRALFTDFEALPRRGRNLARFLFLDDAARQLYLDWPEVARGAVASLHLYAGRNPDDAQLGELVDELSERDPDFRRWWADHDVHQYTYGAHRFRHPVVGELILNYEAFAHAADPEQVLGLYTAEGGSPSEQALRLLVDHSAIPTTV